MKKLYQEWKWIRHSKRRADAEDSDVRRKARRRIDGKVIHRQADASHRHVTRGERKIQKRGPIPKPAPPVMSLIDDPIEIINYVNAAERSVTTLKRPVFFDFKNITTLSSDAVNFLMAALDAKPLRDTGSKGNLPADAASVDMLVQCGFFERVHANVDLPKRTKSILILEDSRQVHSEIAQQMRRFATKHTLGKDVKNRYLFETAVDCMANSQEHARPGYVKSAKWFFLVYFDEKTRVSHFTFIDRGVGILESIRERDRGFFANLLFRFKTPTDVLTEICKGTVGSRTNEPNRGKGLPKMYRYFKTKQIYRFLIISNGVFADFENNDIHPLAVPFQGTCIHWELRP